MRPNGPRRGPAGLRRFPGSPDLETALRRRGASWLALRAGLVPHWGRLRSEAALVLLLVILGPVAVVLLAHLGVSRGVLWGAAAAAALWTGAWWTALLSLRHEGAHFLLHPDRRRNDRRTDLLCAFAFDRLDRYRHRHWLHHQRLGRPDDPENAYFDAPGLRWLLLAPLGGALLANLRERLGEPALCEELPPPSRGLLVDLWILLRALVLHGVVVGILLAAGGPPAAVAWAAAVLTVQPTLDRLRQVAEHRRLDADPLVDFNLVPHGSSTRLFRGGLAVGWMGAFGHRRHLLHHWDPSVSATRLADMEELLASTPLGEEIARLAGSYEGVLAALVARAVRRPPPELDGV